MTDNNNLIVYCEYEDGKVADVSLELLTKGRVLADKLGVKLEALVIGDKLDKSKKRSIPMESTLYIRLRVHASIPILPIPMQAC